MTGYRLQGDRIETGRDDARCYNGFMGESTDNYLKFWWMDEAGRRHSEIYFFTTGLSSTSTRASTDAVLGSYAALSRKHHVSPISAWRRYEGMSKDFQVIGE